MKKAFLALITALLLLSSCAGNKEAAAPQTSDGPYIEVMTLTQEQQEIMNLVVDAPSAGLYNFAVSEDFKSVSVTLDIYQFGELIETKPFGGLGLFSQGGKIAVLPDADSKSNFLIRLTDGSGLISYTVSADQNVSNLNSTDFYGFGKAPIKEGETYTLYTRVFSKSDAIRITGDMAETPEGLKEFEYAFIIRCEFSTEPIRG